MKPLDVMNTLLAKAAEADKAGDIRGFVKYQRAALEIEHYMCSLELAAQAGELLLKESK